MMNISDYKSFKSMVQIGIELLMPGMPVKVFLKNGETVFMEIAVIGEGRQYRSLPFKQMIVARDGKKISPFNAEDENIFNAQNTFSATRRGFKPCSLKEVEAIYDEYGLLTVDKRKEQLGVLGEYEKSCWVELDSVDQIFWLLNK